MIEGREKEDGNGSIRIFNSRIYLYSRWCNELNRRANSLSLPFIFSVAFEFVGSARGVNWGRSSSGDGQVSRGKRAALTKRNWRKKARLEKRVESAYDSHGLLSFPERENRGEKSTIRLSSEIQRTRRNLSGVVCAIFSRAWNRNDPSIR